MKNFYLFFLPLMMVSCGNNSNNVNEENANTEESNIEVPVASEVIAQEEKATEVESYIMTPGETYYVSQEMPEDKYGIITTLVFEMTIYKDNTMSGQVIEKRIQTLNKGRESESNYPIEGEWEETSKHDKKVLEVEFELAQSGQYYTIYVDEEHNVFINDLNATPVKLQQR